MKYADVFRNDNKMSLLMTTSKSEDIRQAVENGGLASQIQRYTANPSTTWALCCAELLDPLKPPMQFSNDFINHAKYFF